ncbi:caspase-3-like isoform X2 [Tubulanus polymorphus]|uniref:caspase-3-like isoform X2 n=1 Tax=Tubulanus polymorphus TaxID=672921 RepID=UPI003DA2C255
MFLYCSHTHRLLYLTPEAELMGFIIMKYCGLTFDPLTGSLCVIDDDHVLLTVYSDTNNRGSVISIRYNNVGFIDHRIILNSTDTRTCDIHHVCNSNAVVIHHWDNSNKQRSLRFYNINTVEPAPDVRGNVCESGGIDQYYMNREHRGLALIISNKEFDNGETRIGTEFDVESLRGVFSDLGFEVVVCKNLTAKEMKSKIREAAANPIHGESAAFVCVILSHGKKGDKVIGTDDEAVRVEELVKPFKGDACEALAGKPKPTILYSV